MWPKRTIIIIKDNISTIYTVFAGINKLITENITKLKHDWLKNVRFMLIKANTVLKCKPYCSYYWLDFKLKAAMHMMVRIINIKRCTSR